MDEIIIKIEINDEQAPFFEGRKMIVFPVSDHEAGQFGVALKALADVVELNRKCLATLMQVLETRGSNEPDIARTLEMMIEPNRLAVEQIDFLRVLLGRSARLDRTFKVASLRFLTRDSACQAISALKVMKPRAA